MIMKLNLPEEAIFALLRHELPATRFVAAKTMQEQKLDRTDHLIEMINDPDRYARYGACNGLAYAGWNSGEAVDAILLRMVQDEDILFRYFAVDALTSGKGKAYGLHGAAERRSLSCLKSPLSLFQMIPEGTLPGTVSNQRRAGSDEGVGRVMDRARRREKVEPLVCRNHVLRLAAIWAGRLASH